MKSPWYVELGWFLLRYLIVAVLGLLAPLVLVMDRAEVGEHYWRGVILVAFGAVVVDLSRWIFERAKAARKAMKQSMSLIR